MAQMKIGRAGVQLIKNFEGYHKRLPNGDCKAYLDTLVRPALRSKGYKGLWTIGWGNTGPNVTEGTVWTRAQAEHELMKMIRRHENAVNRAVKVELTQNQFDALVSLSYNMGISKAKSLINKLNRGDYEGAANSFRLYNKSGGIVRRGLVRRRAAETKLFRATRAPTPVQASRRLTLLQRVRQFIAGLGITAAAVAQFFSDAWAWLRDNPDTVLMAALGVSAILWLILRSVEQTTVQDYEEGRYVPSGYGD